MLNIRNFTSYAKRTPFAPEWSYFIGEEIISDINIKQLYSFLIKEKNKYLN